MFPACYSEKSIAKARASVMIYNGGSSGIADVHVYHHPVNNTYRIVGRKDEDLSVCLPLVDVKCFFLYLLSAYTMAFSKGLTDRRPLTSCHN